MTHTQIEEFIGLRREVIGAQFGRLNDAQKEAALHTQGPLLLLAGAGSGKTTVLIHRIANLLLFGSASDSKEIPLGLSETDLAFLRLYRDNLENDALRKAGEERAKKLCALDPVEPWQILAITFTNKAANELKERLHSRLGESANDIWAMTFHAACVRILRRYIDRLGYEAGFTIYDTADCISLVKRILGEMNLDDKTYPPRTVLAEISKAKDAMLNAEAYEQIANQTGEYRKQKMADIYTAYENRLRGADALDFDDLLFLTVRLLQENEEVRSHYQRQFRYVLIDEYQDTNNLQYLFAGLLAGGHGNICVVGDDDQSIYKFRGATIQNILNFEQQYTGAKTIRLEQNYRSTGHILAAANSVIGNNEGRKGKTLWTGAGMGEPLTHYIARDQSDEADYVAKCVLAHIGRGGSWSDHAVLYRMSALSRELEFAFKKNGIPYKVHGGMSFLDYAEIKDILAYMATVVNPGDDLRLLRIINVPARGIGQTTVEKIREIASNSLSSVSQVLAKAREHDELQRTAAKLGLFMELISDLREKAVELPLADWYDLLLDKTGYLKLLQEKPEENAARIEHIWELKSQIIAYKEQNPEGDLKGFLDEMALYATIDEEEAGEETEKLIIMTMHSAKGLEFDQVYIVGMEEGIFPGYRSIGDKEELEEERRLCYVGLTRAKEKLHLISARQRMLFGKTGANMPSRFLEEIPEEQIEQEGMVSGKLGEQAHPQEEHFGYRKERMEGLGFRGTPQANSLRPVERKAPANAAIKNFAKGDLVNHKAFGKGTITQLTLVGGDALAEITFEGIGTKRLMLKSAALHMTKI